MPNQGLADLKKDLTANHFSIGTSEKTFWETENRTQFQKREMVSNRGEADRNKHKYDNVTKNEPTNWQSTANSEF